MPEDKIVAAERSILEIAAELKRLRDAANLLNGAQTQIDGVLTAVKGVIDATREFTAVCGPIVEKLASSDIIRKLDDLELSHQKQREALEAVGGKVQAGDEQARAAMQAAIDSLSDVEKLASAAINRKLDALELSHQKQREALEAVGGKVQAGDELARAAMQAAIDSLSERLAQANLSDFGNLNAGLAAAVAGFREQMQEVRLEIVSAVQAAAALVVDGAVEREAAAIQRASEIQTLLVGMQAFSKISDGRFVQFELANKRRELLLLLLVSIGLLALVWLVLS